MRRKKIYSVLIMTAVFVSLLSVPAYASGDVAGAVESTWSTASQQIKTVVDNVIFPAIDLILAVFFFAKLGMAYFDFRKTGQFEWTAPAILFACLVFTLTAPNYIWGIVGLREFAAERGGDDQYLYGILSRRRYWMRYSTGSTARS